MNTIVPPSTYRLQINRLFPFRDAVRILPYLNRLGAGAVYASPYLKNAPGSLHGYAITDPQQIDPGAGTEEDHEVFCGALKALGLGLLLDIVPNHLAAHPENVLWTDVLRHGERSAYADFFDIQWNPPNAALRGKVLLPVLSGPYGEELERGEIRVDASGDEPWIVYRGLRFPIDPRSRGETRSLESLNGRAGEPESFAGLHELLERQHYRLADWRSAAEEINYRRFFNINDLAAIRIQEPQVFETVHKLVLRWVREGKALGLRVDHPDGLYDPAGYFRRLQEACAPDSPPDERPFWVVVEKILDRQERLRGDWLVHGTVGYEYLNLLNGLFVDRKSGDALARVYDEFIGHTIEFDKLVHDAKLRFVNGSMASEAKVLGHRLNALSERDLHARDLTLYELTRAIKEVIACFPVYRTYAGAEGPLDPRDERSIREAVEKARASGEVNASALDYLERTLFSEEPAAREFTMRFQQLTSPVTAKGFEDTALYVSNRLLSLNEVGGDPSRFGAEPAEFHARNAERLARPYGLLPASTHDTKRSDDVRHRLNVLSEMSGRWRAKIEEWSAINARHKTELAGEPQPRRNTEYFVYQTLLGAWPEPGVETENFRARLWASIEKSIREAKIHTDWLKPNAEYEDAVRKFLEEILRDREFLDSFLPFCRKVADLGRLNSLSALVLRLASPGVFDVYQGDERWNLSLVDPDNRRPVDFAACERLLEEATASSGEAHVKTLFAERADGRIKAFMLNRGLLLRRERPELFFRGDYRPCAPEGPNAERVVAFERTLDGTRALAVAARFFASAPESPAGRFWEKDFLRVPGDGHEWTDAISDRPVRSVRRENGWALPLEEVFACCSSTILIRKS